MTWARRLRAYAGLGSRVLATRLGSRRPFKVTFALTDRCDCRCAGCLIWRKPKGREVTAAEVGRVLAAAPSVRWVNLTGGEIFLRDDVPAVAAACREALPDLAVLDFPTTGQRTDRIVADVERIATLGVPRLYVTVSVEGPPAVHDALRGRPGAFAAMARTFAALRDVAGVRVYLGMTLSDQNARLVERTLEAVGEVVPGTSWRDLHLNVYTRSDHYYDNAASGLAPPAPGDLEAALACALRAREQGGAVTDWIEATYLRLLPEFLATGRSPLPCQSLRAGVFVAANGDLYPCTVYGRKLGNVLDTPLEELLASGDAADARDVIARDACPGCWSPCEANPTIVASAPESLWRPPRRP
jgi:MoaA/NifB/PqqE/SkfB family radical SAM enzyme